MKIDKENTEHVQEILDKYGVSGLNDLDQRLFEWQESSMKTYDVEVTRAVTFKIRVRATSFYAACSAGESALDDVPEGPNADHGTYMVHPSGTLLDTGKALTLTFAKEVEDA